MIEFTNIRIQAALPLHPFLAEHQRLSLRLVVDKKVFGKTPGVSGDLVTGTWTFNSRFSAPIDNQSLTIVVMTGMKGARIQVVSVTVKMAELLARVKDRVNGYQDFDIFDSSAPLQLKLVMTCHIKSLPVVSGSSQVVSNSDDTVDKRREKTQPSFGSQKFEVPSRDELESSYARAIRMPDQDNNKARTLSQLGGAYRTLYREERRKEDLDKAISLHEEAIRLAVALIERFQQVGNPVDIEGAISHCETALRFTDDHDEDKPGCLSNLGIAHWLRFKRLGDPADLEKSILCPRQALELTPSGHPNKLNMLNNLGTALKFRFELLGSLSDMDDAISGFRKAVDLTPDGHADKPRWLSNLGGALQSRFERFGSLADMEDSISGLRKAVDLTPDGHPDKPSLLNNLDSALHCQFERLGSLADMEDAISGLRKAVDLTPDDHPDKPSRLNNLGNVLQSRFERLGSLTDMEDAISALRKAVDLTPDNHPDRLTLLNNYRAVLLSRFERLGSLTDIADAISGLRKVVDLTPDGHQGKPRRLSNLGSALQSRFERLGSLVDMEDAISAFQKAVDLTPDGHPDKRSWLNNLGTALQSRFKRLGSLVDMEDAISAFQKAVDLTPDDHPDKPHQLSNLGCALQFRFERFGSLADMEDSISGLRKAVDLTPDDHPDKPTWLRNLGNVLLIRFRRLGVGNLERALSAFSTAAKSTSGSAMVRFKAARKWAEVAEEHSKSPLDAFSYAVELLPRIAWLGLAVPDQHALLANVGGVVRDAVAAAIRYGECKTAVVWAEQGRSIVWQNLLGLRSPVDDLRRSYPRLADQLQNIAHQLEGSASPNTLMAEGEVSLEDASRRHSKLAIEWDNLIEEIGRLPNFEGFLKAKSFSQLAPAAHEGPVVILNVNRSQCDALVIIADDSPERRVSAVNIPLERFSYETSEKLFKALTCLLSSAHVRERTGRKIHIGGSQADGEVKFKRILRILWQDVVKPVIEGLAFQTESKRPPRIWWCATGPLAFLPIHAAGLYGTDEIDEKAADYVVSSYTPTLTAILELSEPAVQDDFQVLTVAQGWAPGAPPIPKTEDEVRIVHRLTTGARIVNLMKEDATVERVREEMMESNWIHLACHGQQNPDDPMESGFLLHDKILTLSEIVKMSLPKADFAFLSACQTAMGDEKVAEESVHLAAGMFLSGCRGVIATTWSIRDDDAPKVAEHVYSRIFKDGKPNRKEAAYALHEAVKRLRESGAQCTSWVPFIHIGR